LFMFFKTITFPFYFIFKNETLKICIIKTKRQNFERKWPISFISVIPSQS
jgi:hypothetical protein